MRRFRAAAPAPLLQPYVKPVPIPGPTTKIILSVIEQNLDVVDHMELKFVELLGQGKYGQVFLTEDDKAVKLEYDQAGREMYKLYKQDISMSVLMSREKIGPRVFEEDTKLTRCLVYYMDDKKTTIDTLTSITTMQPFEADLGQYLKGVEFVQGSVLKTELETRLGTAIDKMYEIGILCTDMKPKNVLVNVNSDSLLIEDLKICDFGGSFCWYFVDELPHSSYVEYFKMATKMQFCWLSYFKYEKLIFVEHTMKLIETCIDIDQDLFTYLKVNALSQFNYYLKDYMGGNTNIDTLKEFTTTLFIKYREESVANFIIDDWYSLVKVPPHMRMSKQFVTYLQNKVATRGKAAQEAAQVVEGVENHNLCKKILLLLHSCFKLMGVKVEGYDLEAQADKIEAAYDA